MTAKVQLLVMANGAPQSTILKATFKSPVQMAESKISSQRNRYDHRFK